MKHYTFHKNLANIHIHPSHQRSERDETESHNKMMANTKKLTKNKKKSERKKLFEIILTNEFSRIVVHYKTQQIKKLAEHKFKNKKNKKIKKYSCNMSFRSSFFFFHFD